MNIPIKAPPIIPTMKPRKGSKPRYFIEPAKNHAAKPNVEAKDKSQEKKADPKVATK